MKHVDHSPPLLAGASIVVTRASGTSARLSRAIVRRGGRAIPLPGLALRAISNEGAASLQVRAFDGWIFTSPAAVRFGARLIRNIPKRADVFAVGEGTARALARHGLRANVPNDRFDSEGLLAMPGLKSVRGRRFALVGAPGGRDVIAPTLRRRRATVEIIHVYRRVPPRLTRRSFDAVAAASDPLITLLSSGEALANLVALLPPVSLTRLRRATLVVSSDRLAGEARRHGFGDIVRARSASPDDLLAAAETALARHRL